MKFIREKIFKKLFTFLIYLTFIFNLPLLAAYLVRIQIFKFKFIKLKDSKKKKNLIVFFKSGGVDDLIAAYNKSLSPKNILFLPRFNLQILHKFFIGKNIILKNPIRANSHVTKYIEFLESFLNKFASLFKNDVEFLSFNLLYPEEIVFRNICKKKSIKFYILHKENVRSKGWAKGISENYRKNYGSFDNIYKCAVYNKETRDILVKNNLMNKNKINIVGFPRGINSLKKKNKLNKKKTSVLYFMINKNASIWKKKFSWERLVNSVEKSLFDLAKEYSNIKFIFKGKTGVHSDKITQLRSRYKLSNLSFIDGGVGHDLINKESIIIGFNTTAVIESLISGADVIIPYFKKFRKKPYSEYVHVYDPKLFVNNEKDLKNRIIQKLKNNKNYVSKKYYQKIINYYFDDIQNAPKKLREFLK